nr:uncharacterized protein LOC100183008 isoform X1 [Ciona intestinalis]|eukprot:XP_002124696.1 uncharacterized protein LOC100183008 isoform X1 [Ciona intestinalis]
MPGKVGLEHAARLAAHLSMQRELGKYCDVCICVAEKRFLAHKCVLSANSSKLDALILDAIGNNSNSQDIEIEIQGVSPVGFEKLLEYFYVGEMNLEPHTVMPVWMTAAYLELPDVVSKCNDYCQRSVTCVSSNQPPTEETVKTSDMNNNSSGGMEQGMATLSPPNPCISPTAQVSASPKPGSTQHEQGPKYSQMNTVSATTKEDSPGVEQIGVQHSGSASQKVASHEENGIAWTPLQNATGETFSQNSGSSNNIQNYQQFHANTTQTWSQPQQTWVTTSYQDQPLQVQLASDSNQPAHTPNNLIVIKEGNGSTPEDGEIQIQANDGTFTVPSSGTSMVYTHPSNIQHASIIDVNKLSENNCIGDKGNCENIMLQVERLRIQHQQLQRLQQQQQAQQNADDLQRTGQPPLLMNYLPQQQQHADEPPRKKSKKKKSSRSKSSDTDLPSDMEMQNYQQSTVTPLPMHTQQNQQMVVNNGLSLDPTTGLRTVNPPPDFRIVTEAYRKSLYMKHSRIKEENPISATGTVAELLQRGKSRKRKSTEQNALNNTIRLILDMLEIVDSSDPRVEDALFLIMDRFVSLRENINDPTVRRSLLVKVRHSIHCKKWRVKRQMLKEQEQGGAGVVVKLQHEEEEDNLHG